MKLEDFYSTVSDSLKIRVTTPNIGTELARYDGKDSIPEFLNDAKVVYFQPEWDDRIVRVEVEIKPTKAEKKEWKEYLYNSCVFLATERPEFMPRKKDSFKELLYTFLSWADEYNDGYFSERDEVNTDKYCAYLVQMYDELFA